MRANDPTLAMHPPLVNESHAGAALAVAAAVAAATAGAGRAACCLFSGLVPSPEKPMSEGLWRLAGGVELLVVSSQGRHAKMDLGHRCPRTLTLLHLGLRSF